MEKIKLQTKKNILFLSLYTFSKLSDGYIAADLVKQFIDEGHNLTVIAPREGAKGISIEEVEGFKNIRIGSGPIQKTSAVKKVLNLKKLDSRARSFLGKHGECKFDLIVCMVSHCAFYKTVKFIKKRDGAFVYNMVKDIFPQNAVDMGMLKKDGIVYKWFKGRENKYYAISDVLGALSDSAIEALRRLNPKLIDKKIEVNPNSCVLKNDKITKEQKAAILVKNKIPNDKTVFVYGGNLGKPQGIDFLLEIIKFNEVRKGNAYFVVVGDGTEYKKIEEYFVREGAKNSKLMRRLDGRDFEDLCKASDVGLVFLSPVFTIPHYPSRVLSYMQARLPMLFALDRVSDAGAIAQKNDYGFTCINGELDKFFDFVSEFEGSRKKCEKMGENAYNYLGKNYTVKQSYDIIMKHFL